MSKEDLAKRQKLLQLKEKKLKNPNFYISDCRLCIRNLPLNVNDQDLRKICTDSLKLNTKFVRIKEVVLEKRLFRNCLVLQFVCCCIVFPIYDTLLGNLNYLQFVFFEIIWFIRGIECLEWPVGKCSYLSTN